MAEVRYLVEDVDAAVLFYQDFLGFELMQQFGDAMAIVERGDLALWLAGPAASARKPMADGTVPEPGGWARIVLKVDDLDETLSAMRARGVRLRNDVVQGPGGAAGAGHGPIGQSGGTVRTGLRARRNLRKFRIETRCGFRYDFFEEIVMSG